MNYDYSPIEPIDNFNTVSQIYQKELDYQILKFGSLISILSKKNNPGILIEWFIRYPFLHKIIINQTNLKPIEFLQEIIRRYPNKSRVIYRRIHQLQANKGINIYEIFGIRPTS